MSEPKNDRAVLEELLDFIDSIGISENQDGVDCLLEIKAKTKEIRQQLATQPIHTCETCKFEGKSWKYCECRYCLQRYYGDVSNRLKRLEK